MRLSNYCLMLLALATFTTTARGVTKYEAEEGTRAGGATLGACGCYSGGWNVENLGGPSHGTVNLTVVSETAQTVTMTVAYDNGSGSTMSADVIVNGVSAGTLSMPDTGSWSTVVLGTISISLNAGTNTIRFAGVGSGWVAEIDYISLPYDAPNTTKYEGEAGSISGSTTLGACACYSGGWNVENLGGPGHGTLTLSVVSSATQTATMSVAYDNGSGSNLPADVIVNGVSAGTLAMPNTASWSTIVAATMSVPLNVGTNTIEFAGIGSGWVAEIDYISFLGTAPSIVNLNTYGTIGTSDDTTVFQNAINDTATNHNILKIPAGSYIVQPLSLPSDTNIMVDDYATITAKTGYTTFQRMIDVDDVQHVTITGNVAHPDRAVFQMPKSEYTAGEYRHCLSIIDSAYVTIAGISCNDSGGDGFYIGTETQAYSQNVELSHVVANNNSRNGLSIISCDTCNIHDSTFSNTKGENGAASDGPWAGIDIEPNESADRLANITLTNLTLSGNGITADSRSSTGNGLIIHIEPLISTSQAVSITGSGLTSTSNVGDGFQARNGTNTVGVFGPSGSITITSSAASNNGRCGTSAFFFDAGGPVFTYSNNANSNNNTLDRCIDNADLLVERGGGAVNPMGSVHYTSNSVTSTNGHLDYYFSVEDFSSIGLSDITIGSFGTLSGASGATNGLLNGSGVTSVSIP